MSKNTVYRVSADNTTQAEKRRVKETTEEKAREATRPKAAIAFEATGKPGADYSTPIPREYLAAYEAWYKQLPENLQYTGDYDLQGAWLEKLGKPDKYETTQNGHLDDYGKKPSHPTFSSGSKWHDPKVPERTGGEWKRAEDGSWDFYPGPGNKLSDEELQEYFEKYEKGNRVHKRETRTDMEGGDSGPDLQGPPVSVNDEGDADAPVNNGGPRIVINPSTFRNRKDALCVAFNERFRIAMEQYGWKPKSEPTEHQRRFFADTAYADDEVMLRRTIIARILTLDTSVDDPTDEQLHESLAFLDAFAENEKPSNAWEADAISRLRTLVKTTVGGTSDE